VILTENYVVGINFPAESSSIGESAFFSIELLNQ